MAELDQIIPPSMEVVVNGEPIIISPIRIGQLPAFLRTISPVMSALHHEEIDWLRLFGERGDDLLSAIAIAVGKPREWVDALAADEALLLAAKVIEVNADFFTHKVLPQLDSLFRQTSSMINSGSMASSDSSATVTPSTPS